jgi:hypothetical protein
VAIAIVRLELLVSGLVIHEQFTLLAAGSFHGSLLDSEDGSNIFPKQWAISKLHGIKIQRSLLLMCQIQFSHD